MVIANLIAPLNILVAFDGSPASMACALWLSGLPLPRKSKVQLLGVSHPLAEETAPDRDTFFRAAKNLTDLGIRVDQEVLEGPPAKQIIQYASQRHCDLIVMGAIGRRARLGVLLGGVAQEVVEHANQPVLIVRPPASPPRNVILATDGEPHSLQAAEYLGAFPLPEGCRVTILNVTPPLPDLDSVYRPPSTAIVPNRGALLEYAARGEFTSLRELEENQGEEILKTTLRSLKHTLFGRLPVVKVRTDLREGDPSAEIIQYAKEQRSNLIVVGSRGLSQVMGWLLGSVSRRLIHAAPCSVLVVRGIPPPGRPGNN